METHHSHSHHLRSRFEHTMAHYALLLTRIILLFCMVSVPFFWGGRHLMGVGVAGLVVISALLCWIAACVLRGSVKIHPCGGMIFLFAIIAVGVIQIIPSVSTQLIPTQMSELWEWSSSVSIHAVQPLLAVLYEYQKTALFFLASALVFYFLIAQAFGRSKESSFALAFAILITAAYQSVLGIIQSFGSITSLGLVYKGNSTVVTGTYLNHAHFAQLQEMGILVGLGLSLALFSARKGSSIQNAFGKYRTFLLVSASCCTIACIMGLLFSVSRGGILCGFGGILLFLLYSFLHKGKHLSLPIAIVASGVVLVSFYGLDIIISRLETAVSGLDSSGLVRFEIWKTALQIIFLSPWLGSGFGAMRVLSPHFDLSYVPGLMAFNAHNDYLELAVMVGIPCAAFVVLGAIWKLLRIISVLSKKQARHSSYHPIIVGALIGLLTASAHEFIDFGLKQPANVLVFLALIALVGNVAKHLSSDTDSSNQTHHFGRKAYVLLPIFIALVVLPCKYAFSDVRAGYRLARFELMQQDSNTYRGIAPELKAQMYIRQCRYVLQRDPHNVNIMYREASSYLTLADITYTKLLADKLSYILERTVRPTQVWHAPYRPYLRQAYFNLTQKERLEIIKYYENAIECYRRISKENPLSGLALSLQARCLDDIYALRAVNESAVEIHTIAQRLYPTYPVVLWNSIQGGWRAWQTNPSQRDELGSRMIAFAQAYGEQRPGQLGRVYPLIWSVKPDISLMSKLTPNTISGQEQLAHFCLQKKYLPESLEAFECAQELNKNRLDEETPETMGNLAYLKRETRDKLLLEQSLLKRMIPVFKKLGKDKEAETAQSRIDEIISHERTHILELADKMLDKGEYIVVEEILKPILDDPRAKILYAEILLMESRLENFARTMQTLEQTDFSLDKESAERLSSLRKHAKNRGLLANE